MRYKFFTNSERTWKAMFEAIADARESVYLEMFIFTDDMRQYDFLKLLKEKAKSGLRVRIILDSVGSMNFSNKGVIGLKEAGAELYFFSYFLHRTHRKILVVDQKKAFIGGVNFGKNYRYWDDLVLEVRGRLVKHIITSFAKVYIECGGTDSVILAQNKNTILDKTRTWLVEHFPTKKRFVLKKLYKEHLDNAKESIIIITPYFIPNRWLTGTLHQAVLRGVRVEVLVPKTTEDIYFLVNNINYFYMLKLSRLGINFYLSPTMNHSKAMIIDGNEAIVGSQNIDFLSFDFMNEIGVFLKDAKAVKKLIEIYDKWKKDAILLDLKTYKPKWFDYIISPICTIFSSIF